MLNARSVPKRTDVLSLCLCHLSRNSLGKHLGAFSFVTLILSGSHLKTSRMFSCVKSLSQHAHWIMKKYYFFLFPAKHSFFHFSLLSKLISMRHRSAWVPPGGGENRLCARRGILQGGERARPLITRLWKQEVDGEGEVRMQRWRRRREFKEEGDDGMGTTVCCVCVRIMFI